MQPSQNTLVQEIILGIVAGPMAIAAPVLLYLGAINLGGALTIWGIAAGLVVGKLAFNAPSPTQQQQIGTLQAQQSAQAANLQGLVQYALGLFQSLQAQAPVAPPQAQQTPTLQQVQSPVPMPDVAPVANPVTVANPVGDASNPSEAYTAWVLAHPTQQPPNVPTIPAPGPSPFNSGATSGLVATPPPTDRPPQFKTIIIPDVSAPYPAVGQGIPLGQ